MRKLLIIMTVVFGLCFSIIGNAQKILKKEEARNILIKGEAIGSSVDEEGFIVILLRHNSKLYRCTVGSVENYICLGEE